MSAILALVACIIFAVAAFDGHIGSLNLVPLGLAFLAAAHVIAGGLPFVVRRGE